MYSLVSPNFLCIASEQEKSNLFKKEKHHSLQRKVKRKCQVFQKWKGNKKKKWVAKKSFSSWKKQFRAEGKRPRAEPSWKSLSSSYGSSQLGSGSSLVCIQAQYISSLTYRKLNWIRNCPNVRLRNQARFMASYPGI